LGITSDASGSHLGQAQLAGHVAVAKLLREGLQGAAQDGVEDGGLVG